MFYTFFDLADEIGTIGEKLIPNWFAFLVQLVSLIVLLLIVFFVAYKPVKKMLAQRADYIENEVKEAKSNREIAEKNAIQSEKMIVESKKKANEIIEDANKKAVVEAHKIIESAEKEIEQMKVAANEDIERSKEQSLKEIHDEMVDVALSASKEILQREINEADNKRLAQDFIENLNK